MLNIIILTHNNLNSTKQCLENLYKYTEDFNIFIFDNASTDGTISYLQEQKKNQNLSFFLSDKNIGIISGRNEAYSLSKKTYPGAHHVIFLDNDQFVQKDWAESHFKWIDKGYDIVGVEAWLMREDFYPIQKLYKKDDAFTYVGCGGMLVKTKVIDDIGLFDPQFNPYYFEDPDFCFRAAKKGYKIAWNYNHKILHEEHKLLGSMERRIGFYNSWEKFKKKWGDEDRYNFSMKEEKE